MLDHHTSTQMTRADTALSGKGLSSTEISMKMLSQATYVYIICGYGSKNVYVLHGKVPTLKKKCVWYTYMVQDNIGKTTKVSRVQYFFRLLL